MVNRLICLYIFKNRTLVKYYSFFRAVVPVLLFFTICPAKAQLPSSVQQQIQSLIPRPVQKSPNVAAMEKYGDYGVNLYHGLPEISIPVFEVTSGPLKLPISFTYHAAGFKYTDQATWAGLGWTVSAGGQISRSIQGKADETGGTNSGYLNAVNNYNVTAPNCNDMFYKEQLAMGLSDREPDLFSYSFPGKSGKFYLSQNNEAPYLFPEAPVSITRNGVNFFDITDEKGIRYRFGQSSSGSSARESTSTTGGGNTTAWHLMEIHSPDSDDVIQITYQTVGTVQLSDIEHNVTVLDQCNTNSQTGLPCPNLDLTVTQVQTTSTTTQIGIDEIIFKTGKVKFVLGPNRLDLPLSTNVKRLDRIEIYRKEGNTFVLLKTYQLNNNSYFRNLANNQNLRLKLDGITVRDGAGTEINSYSFTYHTNNFSWNMPNHSTRRDWFGFFNGRNNSNLIPTTSIQYQQNTSSAVSNISIGGANREPDTTFLKEAVLRRITFPTGGYTEFQFEPHRYSDGGQTKYGGGLRVRRITSVTGSSQVMKEYRYGTSENGLGIKNFEQNGFFFHHTQRVRSSCALTPCDQELRSRMFFSNSVLGPGYEDSPVVYPTVTEYENGTNVNGKTEYVFDDNTHIGDPLFTVPYSNRTFRNSMSWARGKLTRKSVFNSSGSLVSRTQITYTLLKGQTKNVGQAGIQYITGTWQGGLMMNCTYLGGPFDGFTYHILNLPKTKGIYLESNRTETLYSGTGNHVTTYIKQYDPNYLQVLHDELRASNNPEAVVTKFRYPFNLVNTASNYTGTPNILKQMVLKNMIASPVEQYVITQNTNGSNQRIVSGQITTFRDIGFARYKADSIWMLETASPITSTGFALATTSTSVGWIIKDSRYRYRLRFTSYDSRGNITQISKVDAAPVAYLWAYDGAYAVGEFPNALSTQVAYTSFETNEKGGWTYSGQETILSLGEAKTGKNVYNLSSGGISRTVSGASTSNRFKVSFWARTISGTQNWTFMGTGEALNTTWKLIEREVTSSGFSISGSNIYIDELRIAPLNSMPVTYTYHPSIGIRSAMDPRGRGTYYHYDHFGRLETVLNEDGNILSHNEYTYKK